MTLPAQDFQRHPETPRWRHFAQHLSLPLPVLVGIGVAILVVVLVALFPGTPKLAAPLAAAQTAGAAGTAGTAGARPSSAEPTSEPTSQPTSKPSPLIPKRARRNR